MSSIRDLARTEGFTTIELLIAIFICTIGVIALIGTMDMSRRLTSLSEMKEAASHIAEQKMEEIRTLDYAKVALDGSPVSSTDPKDPGYYVGTDSSGNPSYKWNQKAGAQLHTDKLVIDATDGQVAAAATNWTDGRLSGKVYRYVTEVDDPNCVEALICPGVDYKRVTVAVTVDTSGGPKKPILISSLITSPDAAPTGAVVDGSVNPLSSPDTQCDQGGTLVSCSNTIAGTVSTYYLYDTPASNGTTREEVAASHESHATVAPSGTCTSDTTTGCPKPDLMGEAAPPNPSVTPSLYSYSNEITGGTWPGGAVIRRDTTCTGTPTATDNTKGHMWVTAPLAAPMTLTGDAALSLSTATFNAVSATVKLCVRFYNVPNSLTNLVAAPPTSLGGDSHQQSAWPTTANTVSFAMDFRGSDPDATIPATNRLGIRIWTESSSDADIAAIYDHPLHPSFIQINEAD